LGLFFTGNALFGAGLFFHAFLYNFYLDALDFGEAVMGVAAAALTAGGLIALLPAGRVVDRWGARTTLLGACLFAWTGLSLGALTESAWPVYAAAFVAGLGAVAWRVAMGPVIMQIVPTRWRSRAFSWNVALLVGTGAVWMTGAGAFARWLEAVRGLAALGAHRVALLVGAGATGAAAVCYALGGAPGPPSQPAPATVTVPSDVSTGSGTTGLSDWMSRSIGAVALWALAPALVLPFFNLFFLREHGLPVDRIGLVFGLAHAATAVVIFGSGEIATRIGPRRMLAVWTLGFGPLLWMLASVDALALAMGFYFLQGIVSPASNPLIDEILLRDAPASQRGLVSSWRNAATEIAGIVGAAVGGVLLGWLSFRHLFVIAGSVGAVGAVVLVLVLREPQASRSE
jgi:MFS family permease